MINHSQYSRTVKYRLIIQAVKIVQSTNQFNWLGQINQIDNQMVSDQTIKQLTNQWPNSQ